MINKIERKVCKHWKTLENIGKLQLKLSMQNGIGDDDGLFWVDLLLAENGKVKSND